jgi:hypothetical protein
MARLPCVAAITNAGSAPISRATLHHAASTAAMESVRVPSWIPYGTCMADSAQGWMRMELAYHVEERCVSAEGRRSEYAAVHSRFKIWGCGSGNADDRLHDGVVGQITRPANLQEGVVTQRKQQHIVYKRAETGYRLTVWFDIVKLPKDTQVEKSSFKSSQARDESPPAKLWPRTNVTNKMCFVELKTKFNKGERSSPRSVQE